jgi:hypothetical protein
MPIDTRRIHCGYLGHTAFPKDITEFEIREFFTLSAADLRAIRVDSNRKSRLALALQIGFLRLTGTTLDTYEYIPRSVLECVAMQLKVRAPMLATLRALSRRVMTRHRHQNWGCRYLGISRMTVADEETLSSALVMAYNAGRLQKSLDAEIASGADLAEYIKALEHVGPVAYGHINFRGTYSFPIDRYATRILRLAA